MPAKKGSTAAATVAKGNASPTATRPILADDASLMPRLDHAEPAPQHGGQPAAWQRTFEANISNLVKENFPGWCAGQVDGLQRNGVTLRQRVSQDKLEAAKPGGSQLKTGKLYYMMLRDLYYDGRWACILTGRARPRAAAGPGLDAGIDRVRVRQPKKRVWSLSAAEDAPWGDYGCGDGGARHHEVCCPINVG